MRPRTGAKPPLATRVHQRQVLLAPSATEPPNGGLMKVDDNLVSVCGRRKVTGDCGTSNSRTGDSGSHCDRNWPTAGRTELAHETKNILTSLGHLLFISTSLLYLFIEPNEASQQAQRPTFAAASAYSRLGGPSFFGPPFPSARHFYHSAGAPPTTSKPSATLWGLTSASWPNVGQSRKRDRINSLHEQLNQLRRQLETELRVSGAPESNHDANDSNQNAARTKLEAPLVQLGAPCLSSADCANSISNSHCSAANFTCVCLDQHVPINASSCLAPSLLGYGCQLDAQCQQKVAHSLCVANKCACEPNSFVAHRKDKCLAASKLNDFCLSDGQCQLNDRYSFCKWKIPNVYGSCKCPPNYKVLSASNSSSGAPVNCAPRLGDACLSDTDCQLATPNSICRSPRGSATGAKAPRHLAALRLASSSSWPTSSISSSRCSCAEGFVWSASQLDCERVATEAPSTSTSTTSAGNLEESHKYEMIVIPPGGEQQALAGSANQFDTHRTTQLVESEQLDIKILNSARPRATASSNTSPTTSSPTTSSITSARTSSGCSEQPHGNQTVRPTTGTKLRMSSLGQTCESRAECQLRDPHSDCIEGRCECQMPTPRCGANSTGCHKDTFQCRNGQCISWYFVCDQFPNCDDASDELHCQPNECPRESFQCLSDGSCVARAKICDGKRDCPDASDESQCQPSSTSTSANFIIDRDHHSGTSAHSSSSLWPPSSPSNTSALANPTEGMHREGGSPTATLCHPDAFTCRNGQQCFPAYVFCNAVVDCADGSDEDELICERPRAQRKWLDHLGQELAARKSATSSDLDSIKLEHDAKRQQQQPGDLLRLPAASQTANDVAKQVTNSRPAGDESPLVKTDRASIERLRAALVLARRTPESRGRQRTLDSGRRRQHQSERRAKLLDEQPPARPPDECPRWAFTCANGKCRSSAILCSGVDGCGDNSDEDRCEVCRCQAPA